MSGRRETIRQREFIFEEYPNQFLTASAIHEVVKALEAKMTEPKTQWFVVPPEMLKDLHGNFDIETVHDETFVSWKG